MKTITITVSDDGVFENTKVCDLETGLLTLGEMLEVIVGVSNKKTPYYFKQKKEGEK